MPALYRLTVSSLFCFHLFILLVLHAMSWFQSFYEFLFLPAVLQVCMSQGLAARLLLVWFMCQTFQMSRRPDVAETDDWMIHRRSRMPVEACLIRLVQWAF